MKGTDDRNIKAQIHTEEKVLIGEAKASGKYADEEVTLTVCSSIVDKMYTSFVLTIFNDIHGLITYKADMIDVDIDSVEEKTFAVKCRLIERINVVQRRENFKVKVSIPVTASVIGHNGKPVIDISEGVPARHQLLIEDISALGVFITTQAELEVGQKVNFTFDKGCFPINLNAEILRRQSGEGGKRGYGCKFSDLTAEKESVIRRYIFKLQLNQKYDT